MKGFWDTLEFYGCPQFILAAKLRALKGMLRIWSKSQVGDIHTQVIASKAALDTIQAEISSLGPSVDRFSREDAAHSKYLFDLSLQATFLRDKSRVRWLKDGDRNTSFLHNMVKLRSLNKSISSLTVNQTVLSDQASIAAHVVQHVEHSFTRDHNIIDTGLVERVIPSLVTEEDNCTLLAIPTREEIHATVKAMDGFSAPGPDGFGGCFFSHCWSIIASDVVLAVQSFFQDGFIMPHFNSNVLILIPKLADSDNILDFRPIALANFSFKIISRILADRLGPIAAKIVSPNQSAFIQGRSIADPIILTSECVNLLDNKCKSGNVAIKFDIRKAFDTLDWNFLLRVLRSFGFNASFVNYINNILQSAHLSINVNGKACGYFTCTRGVRQGDPLSPLLFCLAEEVLSRGISLLVAQRNIMCIAGPQCVSPPSHVLFADDVMVFLQGNSNHLRALMSFMDEYAMNSGQVVNKAKSLLFLGKFAMPRLNRIRRILGIEIGNLPFTYLGVPIFVGRPKSEYLLPIADKIRCKLNSWKGKQLSQAGRMQLIDSVVQSHLTYSFQVYEWPKALLKKVQRWIRNFFWNGDPLKDGSALIAWGSCCVPKIQGGLGLKNIFTLNRALLLKRCWDVASRVSCSAIFLHDRFLLDGLQPLSYYKKSSVWIGLKKLWPVLLSNIQWLVGNGNNIRFWKDNWLGEELVKTLNFDVDVLDFLNDKVSTFIFNGEWKLPDSFWQVYPATAHAIFSSPLPLDCIEDKVIWAAEASGSLTSSSAYQTLSPHLPATAWGRRIWHGAIQPCKSVVSWKVLHKKILTDEFLQRRHVQLCSRCELCRECTETTVHLFLDCSIVSSMWTWLFSMFRLCFPHGSLLQDFFLDSHLTLLSFSSRLLWFIAICNLLWCIWHERNKLRHDGGSFCDVRFKQFFVISLRESAGLAFTPSSSTTQHVPIFGLLGLSPLRPAAPRFIPVAWAPPPPHWVKVNTDGSFHDIDNAGFGGIFRSETTSFLGAFSHKVCVSSAIDAEVLAVIESIRVARLRGWLSLWIETDSMLVVHYFNKPNCIPWRLLTRWANCIHIARQMNVRITHIFREGNSVADKLANYGALHDGIHWWDSIPQFLSPSFDHDFTRRVSYHFS